MGTAKQNAEASCFSGTLGRGRMSDVKLEFRRTEQGFGENFRGLSEGRSSNMDDGGREMGRGSSDRSGVTRKGKQQLAAVRPKREGEGWKYREMVRIRKKKRERLG